MAAPRLPVDEDVRPLLAETGVDLARKVACGAAAPALAPLLVAGDGVEE